MAPDWPQVSVFLESPGASVLIKSYATGYVLLATAYEIRATGFSETGQSLVIATSADITVFARQGT